MLAPAEAPEKGSQEKAQEQHLEQRWPPEGHWSPVYRHQAAHMVSCCQFSPDGSMLAYGTDAGVVGLLPSVLWRKEQQEQQAHLPPLQSARHMTQQQQAAQEQEMPAVRGTSRFARCCTF